MKLSDYAKKKGISYDTAWRMWNRGQLQGERREQVKAEEQINYLTKASIGDGMEKRAGKRQK